MKTKLEMAHEWYMKHSESPSFMNTEVEMAWQYADSMQAEADKRENKTRPEVLMVVQQTFINDIEQPRYATSMGDQKRTPKVSRFERSDAVKEVLSKAESMGLIKPKSEKEWQPDWSQAPDSLVKYFAVDENGRGGWFISKPTLCSDHWYWSDFEERIDNDNYDYAPSFGYTGDWRNSLRKRPE